MRNPSVRGSLLALCAVVSVAFAAKADFIDLGADPSDLVNKAPHRGHSKLLVIPVQIDYSAPGGGFRPVDMDALTSFFAGSGSINELTFASYLNVASNNRYTAEVTVAPLVKYTGCPPMLASSAACSVPRGDVTALTRGMDFVRDVFRRAHDENKVDFSQFDVNGPRGEADGIIDGVMMVVNVPNFGIALPITFINGGSNLSGGTGGALVLDGVKIPVVAIGGATFSAGVQHLNRVIVHEFGHVLGLADLYNEHPTMSDPYPLYQGLHYSSMGDWDYGEKTVLPDAESRRALAWQDTRVISGTHKITLQPAAKRGDALRLGQMDANRREYFLVEARGPAGAFDTTIADVSGNPTWGLAVYHVDWSRGPKAAAGTYTERLLSCLDCNAWHPFIRNLESAGHFGLIFSGPAANRSSKSGIADDSVLFQGNQNLASIQNAGVLSATNRYTATNWYDGSPSGISITDIVVNGDHSVTATFTAPIVANPCTDVVCGPMEQCLMTGETAGSCGPLAPTVDDGGLPTNPHNPPATASGCSTGAGQSSSGLLWALPVGLLIAAALRRRKA